MPIIVLGAACNMAAILANGGYMPATAGALAALGKHAPDDLLEQRGRRRPALEPLIDLFALPRWLPFANVFSVGDVLLAIGVVVLIVAAMRAAGALTPTDARRRAVPPPSRPAV